MIETTKSKFFFHNLEDQKMDNKIPAAISTYAQAIKKNVKNQLVKLYNKSLAHKDYSLNFKKILLYYSTP